jgi:hypothetical protein
MREPLQIDHFQPQVLRPDLKFEYTNLLYLCSACNHLKRDSVLPDPCVVALGDSLRVHTNGRIEALDDAGVELIEKLALDEPPARARRRFVVGTIRSFAESDSRMFVEWMRFPDDLPDLSLSPPPRNDVPSGIPESYFEKRRRGELPRTY